MTPAARVQAAIECLDQIIAAARTGGAAADTLVQRYFTTRRYAGSKDRRAVRDLVFDVIRSTGTPPETGRAAMIGHARAQAPALLELFGDASGHGPAVLADGEPEARPSLAPGWQLDMLRTRFGKATDAEVTALLARAPFDLRVNTLRAPRADVLADHPDMVAAEHAPDAVRAPTGLNVETLPAFHAGAFEVQDEGSQLAALAVGAQPGETVVDLCAGAGGKTLALAAAMQNNGRLIAADTDRGRLSVMPVRLARAGVDITEIRLLNPKREWDALSDLAGLVDRVLVDAPCSGTGTWRRNPEARWRLTQDRLAKLEGEQDRLLALAAQLVRPGGSLTYVVCSLLPGEGEARIARFLGHDKGFQPEAFAIPGADGSAGSAVLSPGTQGCDGFFIARLQRVC
ncbi:MAG: RsmB/NOP family class I SAM-dependent RNA methyltransferase [Sandarakinorhabdus sp.]|nr:RsmB/NOP family class I SAM-dependent RNA methyltransferase [Sandarakinorhabdus sp.]